MIKHIFIIFSIACLGLSFARSQNPDPLEFFPHHEGDIWEYWYDETRGYVIRQNRILSDSLGLDGKYHIKTSEFSTFMFDTNTYEIFGNIVGAIHNALIYKLDADSGDSWIGWRNDQGALQVNVVDVFQDILFGQYPTTIKVFFYSDSATGLWLGTHYLASGFGLVRTDVEFSAPEYIIKGAIIDSILYGNVTSIKQRKKTTLPGSFRLHQNYPNPFNPTTRIRYELAKADKVKLTIYDTRGSLIKVLVDEHKSTGSHVVLFDAGILSSGMYFYVLKTSQGVLSKKMLLLR